MARAFGSPLRYIQGQGEFNNLPTYTSPYGGAVCFVIDAFLYESLREKIERIYAGSHQSFITISFGGECCQVEIDRIRKEAENGSAVLYVGIGGGKTLDAVKFCADESGLPLVVVPSSASTDAPVSEIAILYDDKGEYIGSRKMKRNSDLVLVDSRIIAKAPKRLFVAGMGDALATWFEAKANAASNSMNYVGKGYARCIAGMAIAKACYETIFSDGKDALEALGRGEVNEAVENIVECNTLLSGLGFQNTGCAVAHGIHSGFTALPCTHGYMHGEKVAFGIVCQMVMEKTPADEVERVMRFMAEIGLPVTLRQLGVEPTNENVRAIAKKATVPNALVYREPFEVSEESVFDAIFAADKLGKRYLSE